LAYNIVFYDHNLANKPWKNLSLTKGLYTLDIFMQNITIK